MLPVMSLLKSVLSIIFLLKLCYFTYYFFSIICYFAITLGQEWLKEKTPEKERCFLTQRYEGILENLDKVQCFFFTLQIQNYNMTPQFYNFYIHLVLIVFLYLCFDTKFYSSSFFFSLTWVAGPACAHLD
jgi:hypothetical protein